MYIVFVEELLTLEAFHSNMVNEGYHHNTTLPPSLYIINKIAKLAYVVHEVKRRLPYYDGVPVLKKTNVHIGILIELTLEIH